MQQLEMAAERVKDVGILAMDIYFPPNCVLQVPHHTIALSLSGLIFYRVTVFFCSVKQHNRADSRGSEFPLLWLVPAVIKTS
jgi:hypothetical protein